MDILSTTPVNGAEGIALGATIEIEFDEEIDPSTIIDQGNLVISSSASKLFAQGPSLENLTNSGEDYLSSKSYTGVVGGTFTTEDNITFVFTPNSPLEPNKTYSVLVGTGVLSKTIDAPVAEVDNTSTGSFTLSGPFTGDEDDSIDIEIVTAGTLGTAIFKYRYGSVGSWSANTVTDRNIVLLEGVSIHFLSGNFVEADTWTVALTEGIPLDSIYKFSFVTGPETYTEVSVEPQSFDIKESEVGGLKRIDGVASVDSADFAVVSMTPENRDSNLPLSLSGVVITFNKNIDTDSLTEATIKAIMENLPMDESLQQSVNLPITVTVSNNILTIKFTG